MSDADPIEGVDYAFPPIPTAAALKAAGKQFACRYGGPGSASKQLTAGERDQLHAAGIGIVANAEGAADGLKGGWSAGVSWAKSADAFWRTLGLPPDRPIYFSVDFDTTSGDWDELDAAFDGIASVIGRARTGVYGEYSIVKHLAGNGKAKWYWQAYAWSGGQWFAGNHLEQYRNGVRIGGADTDLNRALVADYGQWTGDDMALTDDDIKRLLSYRFASAGLGVAEPGFSIADWLKKGEDARQQVVKLAAKVDQLLARPAADVDEAALAALLAEELVPHLPDGADPAVIADAVAAKFAAALKPTAG